MKKCTKGQLPSQRIYPDGFAEMVVQSEGVGKKWRPGNGTEGELFFDSWCRYCARDKAMCEGANYDECDDNELCRIIGLTMLYDLCDPEYPGEWQYGKDGQPCCTAFVQAGESIPLPRCEYTVDMFEGAI